MKDKGYIGNSTVKIDGREVEVYYMPQEMLWDWENPKDDFVPKFVIFGEELFEIGEIQPYKHLGSVHDYFLGELEGVSYLNEEEEASIRKILKDYNGK
ncbi:MAG: hypothetical protein ACOCQR_00735 [bacterium]